ncbi:MAG TPA: ABC transporter ATP-binding protein [Anaerolineae bacterium]|nr:ABC transporter ATP-binding protein [Anaerolineae bacterium]HQH37797.1 ABC transporter ATP-binding protein [Anaerolineae bacterium]
MNAAVSLHGLAFRYTPTAPDVVQDITLDLPAGAVTAILGPNGSGKTTLLHLILGLLTPQCGQILLAGALHADYAHREVSHMLGLVPQEEPAAFNLNVLETVLLGRAPYLTLLQRPGERDYETAFRALETVGIAALWDRPVPALSGGERQLVILARALTQEPDILLLDEPTSHLDVGNARRILRLMRDLRAQGQTVIFTTHDPNAAAATADYVVLMRQGRVLHAGHAAEAMTAAHLSATYDVPIDVLQDRHGRLLVVAY